jgi:hypothetical protein
MIDFHGSGSAFRMLHLHLLVYLLFAPSAVGIGIELKL